MTQLLDGLEGDRWIERSPHAADRRKAAVRLTRRARSRLARFLRGHYGRLGRVLEELGPRERQKLIELLERLERGLARL